MSFFSVVIPVYNKERYIRRSIDSVLQQTFSDFELVIVDDGSTDQSSNIIRACNDSRVRFFQQANSGVSAARNRGISESRSLWVSFLDADDEYLPDFLQEIYEAARQFPQAGAIYVDSIWLRGGVQVNRFSDSFLSPRLLADYFDHVVFAGENEINSSGIAVRRDVFLSAGTFPVGIRIGEDSDLWMRIAWSTKIAHIPRPLSVYHLDAGDSQWEDDRLKEAYWVTTYRQWRATGRIPNGLLQSTERYYQRYILGQGLRYIMDGNKAAARDFIFRHVNWRSAPKRYAGKVLIYLFLPILPLRRILGGRGR